MAGCYLSTRIYIRNRKETSIMMRKSQEYLNT